MRNKGSENPVRNATHTRQVKERRQEAMKTDRVGWFRRRNAI